MIKRRAPAALILVLGFSFNANAHEGHHHGGQTQAAKVAAATATQQLAFKKIDAIFANDVRPIFDAKCASCHSTTVLAPWYASVPGLHQLIEKDRTDAKKHLEISKGFPFGGHGTPLEDLEAIAKSVMKNAMPPKKFVMMHPSLKLTDDEREKILNWTKAGTAALTAPAHKGN